VDAAPSDQERLATALNDALIAPGNDQERRYRINLYVALTFSRLPKIALPAEVQAALLALQTSAEYKKDETFQKNVDSALKRQGLA
jgi:hypothetical protein